MFSAIARVFRTPDLRRKIAFTLAIIALYRLGAHIPAPFVDFPNVQSCLRQSSAPRVCCRWSTSSPAVHCCSCRSSRSASCRTSPRRSSCSCCASSSRTSRPSTRRASRARRRLTQYTRYLTIALALLQSTTLVTVARSGQLFGQSSVPECQQLLTNDVWWAQLLMIITLTAGTGLIMWFAELVTERGIGNGMSILIFTSIAASFPASMMAIAQTKGFEVFLLVARRRHRGRRLWSCSSSSRSGASRCSTPSAWSVAAPTAARTRTSRSRSTWPAWCPSSSPRRCCTSPR